VHCLRPCKRPAGSRKNARDAPGRAFRRPTPLTAASAPLLSKSSTASSSPQNAAQRRGVQPSPFRDSRAAGFASMISTRASTSPSSQALKTGRATAFLPPFPFGGIAAVAWLAGRSPRPTRENAGLSPGDPLHPVETPQAHPRPSKMFVHMVWFEWRDDASAAEVDAVAAALSGLKGRIPGVVDLTCESRTAQPKPTGGRFTPSFRRANSRAQRHAAYDALTRPPCAA
jgi:hypothetical protein